MDIANDLLSFFVDLFCEDVQTAIFNVELANFLHIVLGQNVEWKPLLNFIPSVAAQHAVIHNAIDVLFVEDLTNAVSCLLLARDRVFCPNCTHFYT